MAKSHCSSHCHQDVCCSSTGYGNILRLQTLADLSDALCLIQKLETALVAEELLNPVPGSEPTMDVRTAAQNLRDFLVEHPHTLPVLDSNNLQVGESTNTLPPQQFNADDIRTFGTWRYLECSCMNVPFLWKECVVTAKDVGGIPFKLSIFDLAKNSSEWAYLKYGSIGTNVNDFRQAVCCLKHHYQQLKMVLEH